MEITHNEIRKILRHRYSLILIDKVLEVKDNSIIGVKNVTATDSNLWGHFPEDPIYPGVLLIETCSQLGGILVAKKHPDLKEGFLGQVNDFKFLQFIVPGDTIIVEACLKARLASFIKADVKASVNKEMVAKGEITYYFKGKNDE